MNKPALNTTNDLVEALTEIEHDQWMHWLQAVVAVLRKRKLIL